MAITVYPQPGFTYPDADAVTITAAGATVDESEYIQDAIDAGFLMTWDPLEVNLPDDRSTAVVPVAPFETIGTGVSVWPQEGRTFPDAAGNPITSIGAMVDESEYIMAAIDAGYLLTWDPLSVYQPDDRTDAGGGASAPLAAQYLVLSADGTLTDERVLTAGTNISFVDSGAGGTLTVNVSGGGDVVGPVSAVDNHIAVFSGTTGKIIKNSAAVVDGSGNVAAAGLTLSGNVTLSTPGATVDGVDLTAQATTLAGKVTGPVLSADESLVRFDGLTGKLVQGSVVSITDAGNISGVGDITLSGTVDGVDVSALNTTVTALGVEVDGLAVPSYLTLANTGTLTNERALAVTAPIVLTDGGAGGAATLSAPSVVVGPASSLDNQIARFDGITGKLIQAGLNEPSIDDSGNIVMVGAATVDGVDVSALSTTVTALATGSYLTLGADAALANERVLTAGAGVAFTDTGANGTLTVRASLGSQNVQVGTTYTLALTDAWRTVNLNNAAGTTVTVPNTSTVNFPLGTTVYVFHSVAPAGQVTVAGAGGVSILVPPGKLAKSVGNNSTLVLKHLDTNAWSIEGELEDTASYLTLGTTAGYPNERVLTAGTGVQLTDGGAGSTLTVSSTGNGARNTQSGTTYTLVLADAGVTVSLNNAAPITLTIPNTSTVNFPLGTEVYLHNGLAGVVSLVAAGGVTLISPLGRTASMVGIGSAARIFHLAANFWVLEGDFQSDAQYLTLGTTTQHPNERVLTAGSNITLTDGGAGSTLTIAATGSSVVLNNQTGTTYTFVIGDAGKLVTGSNASAITFTIPANGSVAYPIGTVIQVTQIGAGQITVAITTDTLNNPGYQNKTRAQYSMLTLTKITSTSWIISGDMAF